MGHPISHETAVNYLNHYSKMGILNRKKLGKQVFYSLIPNNAVSFISLLEQDRTNLFLRKTSFAVQLAEISNLIGDCYFALLFGSAARGEAKKTSDLDIFIVDGKPDLDEISKKEAVYGIKLSVHQISRWELRARWHSEPIYKGMWKDRIILKNFLNFWEFSFKEGKP